VYEASLADSPNDRYSKDRTPPLSPGSALSLMAVLYQFTTCGSLVHPHPPENDRFDESSRSVAHPSLPHGKYMLERSRVHNKAKLLRGTLVNA
jgi:hypothetical protein